MGLCPKCDSWFACYDFFDASVAMPCCPHCHLPPTKLDYRFPQAADDPTVLVVNAAAVAAAETWSPSRPLAGEGNATAAIDHPETTTATVITVAGTLNADPMTRLLDMLAAQYIDGDVIIDLSGVMMTSPSAIRSLVARLSAWTSTTSLRIVCARLTARRLLRTCGAGDLPLDSSMANALYALSQRTLHRHGGVRTPT